MKTLNTYINEWKANTNSVSSINTQQYFVYKPNERGQIKIFEPYWPQFKDYKDKVYVNGENVELNRYGYTIKKFKSRTCEVEIKDINDINNCKNMFFDCKHLISVSLFDTSKVNNMCRMFSACYVLEDVPLFDISKVEDMNDMFYDCDSLNEQTKQIWSQVYNFKKNKKKQ